MQFLETNLTFDSLSNLGHFSCKVKFIATLCVFTFCPALFLPLISHFRKLKKLCRTLKDKRAPKETVEQLGRRQQWHLDYDLEPFDGLTPEYMEMSEWLSTLCKSESRASSGFVVRGMHWFLDLTRSSDLRKTLSY